MLLSTRKVQELTLASRVLSKFPNASITQLTHANCESIINNYCFITLTLFHPILVSPNPLKTYRHAFQWLHCVISVCIHNIMEYADDKQIAGLKLCDFAGYDIKHGGQTTESQVANALEAKEADLCSVDCLAGVSLKFIYS